MNIARLAVIAATLAVTAGSALAQEFVVADEGFVSTRTRAEVIAEVIAAREAGTLGISDYEVPPMGVTGTPRTRAEVAAEVEAGRQHAGINDLYFGG